MNERWSNHKTKNTRTLRNELLRRLRFKNKIVGNYPTGIYLLSKTTKKNVLTRIHIRKKHTRAKSATNKTTTIRLKNRATNTVRMNHNCCTLTSADNTNSQWLMYYMLPSFSVHLAYGRDYNNLFNLNLAESVDAKFFFLRAMCLSETIDL